MSENAGKSATIELTRGYAAVVDADDFQFLTQFKWCASDHGRGSCVKVYARTRIGAALVRMHRLILNAQPNEFVDHINGDTLDNRRSNLRLCTLAQNNRNRDKAANKSSVFKGVFKRKDEVRWAAQIKTQGQRLSLGRFETEHDAAHVYDEAARRLFGEFAKLNFPT